jgi:hypothetical protein
MELQSGRNRLGRGRNTDFCIDHPTVSAVHCEISCEQGEVLVRDCNSTNGTFINDQPIKESRLTPGQTLRLGDVEMVLETAPVTVAIPHVDFREPPPPPPLADGSVACLNHPEVRARRQCVQCHKYFCEACVHTLRRVGGKVLKLCPWCSGPCEIIPGREEPKRKKKSLLASLWPFKKTLKMSRKRDA